MPTGKFAVMASVVLIIGSAACSPNPTSTPTSVVRVSPTSLSTETATATAVPTKTNTTTPTSTATSIATPTSTTTPTATSTATKVVPTQTRVSRTNAPVSVAAASIQPGTYPQNGRCAPYTLVGRKKGSTNDPAQMAHGPVPATMCITSIIVRPNGDLQFDAKWVAAFKGSPFPAADKPSDVGNSSLYVTDNLGRRYDFIELSGSARDDSHYGQSTEHAGWYVIPPAKAGATSFTFHVDDQGIAIGGIVLTPP